DTPADAAPVKPTINCDPAGREITNYVTRKDSDPLPGTPLQPGEVVHYTISVTQQGSVPAEAVFTDALADVLDDATYNGDAKATIGTVEYVNGALAWNGTIPVGQVAQVTYSVTVKGAKALGNRDLVNPVTSPGCVVKDGQTVDCDTKHPVPEFDLKLTKKVLGSHEVAVGDKVRYRLQVTNLGPDVAPAPITVSDKLPKGLELKGAKGSGWVCKVKKAYDNASCVLDADLQVGQQAPAIIVVTKTNKDASDHMVNVAKVSANGDGVKKNNRSHAAIRVGKRPALPRTGFQFPLGY
uniref:DUF7927 domain-containing protein n=1 Tax=Nocardioides sp. LHG3406-4 TaxID=2804575 RepID=UPI003CFA1BAF